MILAAEIASIISAAQSDIGATSRGAIQAPIPCRSIHDTSSNAQSLSGCEIADEDVASHGLQDPSNFSAFSRLVRRRLNERRERRYLPGAGFREFAPRTISPRLTSSAIVAMRRKGRNSRR